jgi:hypothetical protein
MDEHDPDGKKTVSNDYTVGYGRPPKTSQFRKGQSGNPRGRPKNAKSRKTLIATALNEKVIVNENGERKAMSKRALGAKQVANGVARGDLPLLRLSIELLGEGEERDEQISAAVAGSSARERVTAKLNRLRELRREPRLTTRGACLNGRVDSDKRHRGQNGPRLIASRICVSGPSLDDPSLPADQ